MIHAVGSGVGLAALEIAKFKGNKVFGTSRTREKLEKCLSLGLDLAINTGENPGFAGKIKEETEGRGVDVVLDLVGARFFEENLKSLALQGRLILVGLVGGRKAEIDLGMALGKRLQIIGTVLRSRSRKEKAEVTSDFEREILPFFKTQKIKPHLDRVFPLKNVRQAHDFLESNESFGKIVLEF